MANDLFDGLGQKLDEKQIEAIEKLPADAPFSQKLLVKHRRFVGKTKEF